MHKWIDVYLSIALLRSSMDPDLFKFNTTAELEELKEIVGQERALDATHAGLGITKQGFNLGNTFRLVGTGEMSDSAFGTVC